MKVQDKESLKRKGRKAAELYKNSSWLHLSEDAQAVFQRLCVDIVQLIDNSSDISLKLEAVSAIEVLANKFPSDNSVFGNCLVCICKKIGSDSMELSSSCLRAAGALTNVLGQKALIHLPQLMENMIRASRNTSADNNRDMLLSVLIALEAVEDKVGSFLNPYLESICELLVLHPDIVSSSNPKLKSKADAVRKLLVDRIPVSALI